MKPGILSVIIIIILGSLVGIYFLSKFIISKIKSSKHLNRCIPKCEDKTCGDNGCEGTCGKCQSTETCENNKCVKKSCHGDTDCPEQSTCSPSGECICNPNCNGKDCGNDGCGGSCGNCKSSKFTCKSGQCVTKPCKDSTDCPKLYTCSPSGQCICESNCGINLSPTEEAVYCGQDDSCGNICRKCVKKGDVCIRDKYDALTCCTPKCDNKTCGDDGCGGSCGKCDTDTQVCKNGTCCTKNCKQDQECGDDGCGGYCGKTNNCKGTVDTKTCRICSDLKSEYSKYSASCNKIGTNKCCKSNCEQGRITSKECGYDGCMGSCGKCDTPSNPNPEKYCLNGNCVKKVTYYPSDPNAILDFDYDCNFKSYNKTDFIKNWSILYHFYISIGSGQTATANQLNSGTPIRVYKTIVDMIADTDNTKGAPLDDTPLQLTYISLKSNGNWEKFAYGNPSQGCVIKVNGSELYNFENIVEFYANEYGITKPPWWNNAMSDKPNLKIYFMLPNKSFPGVDTEYHEWPKTTSGKYSPITINSVKKLKYVYKETFTYIFKPTFVGEKTDPANCGNGDRNVCYYLGSVCKTPPFIILYNDADYRRFTNPIKNIIPLNLYEGYTNIMSIDFTIKLSSCLSPYTPKPSKGDLGCCSSSLDEIKKIHNYETECVPRYKRQNRDYKGSLCIKNPRDDRAGVIGNLICGDGIQIQYSFDGNTYYPLVYTLTKDDLLGWIYTKKIKVPQDHIPPQIKSIYFKVSNKCGGSLITVSIEDINIVYKTSPPPPPPKMQNLLLQNVLSQNVLSQNVLSQNVPQQNVLSQNVPQQNVPQQNVSTGYNKTHIIIITVCSVFFIGIISLIIYLTTKSKTKFN